LRFSCVQGETKSLHTLVSCQNLSWWTDKKVVFGSSVFCVTTVFVLKQTVLLL
jgi:hypothetical protein